LYFGTADDAAYPVLVETPPKVAVFWHTGVPVLQDPGTRERPIKLRLPTPCTHTLGLQASYPRPGPKPFVARDERSI